MKEPEVGDDFKETIFSKHTIIQIHIWSHRNSDSLHKVCASSNQIKKLALRRKHIYKVSSPGKKLLVIETCWQSENQFSPKEYHGIPTLLTRKEKKKNMPWSVGQYLLPLQFFVCLCVYLVLFCLFGYYFVVLILCLFLVDFRLYILKKGKDRVLEKG